MLSVYILLVTKCVSLHKTTTINHTGMNLNTVLIDMNSVLNVPIFLLSISYISVEETKALRACD